MRIFIIFYLYNNIEKNSSKERYSLIFDIFLIAFLFLLGKPQKKVPH